MEQRDLFFDWQAQAFGEETQKKITDTELVFMECN